MFSRFFVPANMGLYKLWTGVYKVAFRLWEGFPDGRADAAIGSANAFIEFFEKRGSKRVIN